MNKKFTIYHICCVSGDPGNGIDVVIPQHALEQSKYMSIVLINLDDYKYSIEGIKTYNYSDYIRLGYKKICVDRGIYVFHGVYLPRLIKFWKDNVMNHCPYVVIPHGSITYGVLKKHFIRKLAFCSIIGRSYLCSANAVQFLSVDEKRNSSHYLYTRSITIPNGINSPHGIHVPRKLNTKRNICIVYIGRYDTYHKGLDLLLKACVKERFFLRRNGVSIELYGTSKGKDKKKLKLFAIHNDIMDIVEFHGPVFGEEKHKILDRNAYFIHTSRLEGMPMGIIEAYSYGLPILATQTSNAGVDIKKYSNGMVAETSIKGVCELFHFAIDNIDRYGKMSENSLDCSKQYHWGRIAKYSVWQYAKYVD